MLSLVLVMAYERRAMIAMDLLITMDLLTTEVA